MVSITIQFDKRENGTKTAYERAFKIDPEDIPLLLLEGFQESKAAYMREAVADLLDLTEAESRQLRTRHMRQISEALNEAIKVPNG